MLGNSSSVFFIDAFSKGAPIRFDHVTYAHPISPQI
jgi:hypothetical protein